MSTFQRGISYNESNKFENVNIRTFYLISGYVRIVDIKWELIPLSIIKLVIKFYYSSSKIIYIYSNHTTHQYASINIADLDQNKNYQCKVIITNAMEHI